MKLSARDVLYVALVGIAGGALAGVVGYLLGPVEPPAQKPVVVVETVSALPENWRPVSPDLAQVLRTDGEAADRAVRDWTSCWEVRGDTTWIVCPDGYSESS